MLHNMAASHHRCKKAVVINKVIGHSDQVRDEPPEEFRVQSVSGSIVPSEPGGMAIFPPRDPMNQIQILTFYPKIPHES